MTNSIKNKSPTLYLASASLWPGKKVAELQKANPRETGESKIRLLHALRLITSLIALPILLLTGILEATYRTIICQTPFAKGVLQYTALTMTDHLCAIPVALTGIFTTASLAQKLDRAMAPFAEVLMDIVTCRST